MPIFNHWSTFKISQFIPYFEVKTFVRNDIIFKEGDVADKIYFIWNGEIEVFNFLNLIKILILFNKKIIFKVI